MPLVDVPAALSGTQTWYPNQTLGRSMSSISRPNLALEWQMLEPVRVPSLPSLEVPASCPVSGRLRRGLTGIEAEYAEAILALPVVSELDRGCARRAVEHRRVRWGLIASSAGQSLTPGCPRTARWRVRCA